MAVKKLIEVALPLDAINAAAAREKSIRHGHPSTLHLWWARRPLAAARAVIWASLVDDPSSHPELYPTEEEQDFERARLFKILEDLVVWENSNNPAVLAAAKAEIRKSMGTDQPALLDPFAGGGAIPLEAQRLGLKPLAQDLNPVPVMINKAMIEIPPLFKGQRAVNPNAQKRKSMGTWDGNQGLSEDVEYYGNWMREEAYRRIGYLYPSVKVPANRGGGKATPIAWIWARTVKCPNPACGCETPLVRSFDLAKKKGKEYHIAPSVVDDYLQFDVVPGKSTKQGTVNRKGAACIKCGTPIGFPYIRSEASAGRMSHRLMAVVAEGSRGRLYFPPDDEQVEAAQCQRPDDAPSCDLVGKARVNVGNYGFVETADLFTDRQLTMLCTLCELLNDAKSIATRDALSAGMKSGGGISSGLLTAEAYGETITIYLAFLIDKLTDYHSSICSWNIPGEKMRQTFGRQAIPMCWDFAECNPFCSSSGSYKNMLTWVVKSIAELPHSAIRGEARQFDAQSDNGLRGIMVSTDPPYYDNIDYADLSDYFYAWMRHSLRPIFPDLFRTISTPKAEELVASAFRDYGAVDARSHFEEGMLATFNQVYLYARDDVPVTIYYAFKQTETESSNSVESTASTGWETMLSAIIKAGFSVMGTWPMRTEKPGRSIGIGANALASSIVLVCRKRDENAPKATRRDFVNALKRELRPALDKLRTSNIAPVDMAQSAIGPGIGVFSRFSKVLEANGDEMTVRAALQIINQELDLYFSDQDSDLDRDSRFCVDLYTQIAFNEIRFGEADVLARAKNTSIDGIAASGALSSGKSIVRLLGRDELKDTPDPNFCWLFTQQLTHAMETGGIEACAQMTKGIYDSRAENAKALAYRLFTIADKKGWAQEAFAYNSLVVAWPDIQDRAAQLQAQEPVQYTLDLNV